MYIVQFFHAFLLLKQIITGIHSSVHYTCVCACLKMWSQIVSFAPLDVSLGMYERVYYPLTSEWALATNDDGSRAGLVVDIDRTASTPVITLRSPLQV